MIPETIPQGLSLDQLQFLHKRSIPFLKHWPVECLASNPQACLFHFFSRGTVIVRDSNYSDWIYVVKSGSLSVLKKLVEVHPRGKKQSDSDSESEDEELKKLPIYQSFGTWNHKIKRKKRRHSKDKEVYRNQMEMEKRLEQTLPGFHNNQDRLGVIDYDEIIQEHKSRVLPTRRMSTATGLLPKITVQEVSEQDTKDDKENDEEIEDDDKTVRLPKIRRTSKRVLFEEPPEVEKQESNNLLKVPKRSPQGVYLATEPTKRRSSRKHAIQEELFQKQIEYEKRMHQELSNTYGRKTIANELDNKPVRDFTLTEKDIRPMFVQVQVLERGQYFGLTKHVFPEQAGTFCIVSNGAECIMISKKFFFDKANEAALHNLREVETLLPPEEELQEGLQEYVDWKAYRAKVYNRLVKNKLNRTTRQRQFPTQISGQYNFRTGPLAR